MAQALRQSDFSGDIALRKHVDGRLAGLRTYRYSWWVHWRELADYLLPRRYKWLITPNMQAKGSPINQHILDSTATLAARNLASGMMSGVSSPTRPWFKLKVGRIDSTQTSPISLWLAECERLMMLVFQESNFYNSLAVLYFDLVIFGTAAMLIYEDSEDVINCYNPCAGEYFVENDYRFRVETFYREFTLTVKETVEEFKIENVSPAVAQLYKTGGPMWSRELVIGHALERNTEPRYEVPSHFRYREVYWELNQSNTYVLRKGGFHEKPHIVPRWDLVSNDSYGRSPAMDALPDTKQLQQEVKRKAQGIDKQVNPPMIADMQLKNQPASLLPGGVTYVHGLMSGSGTGGRVGFAPVYEVKPDLGAMMEDLNEVRDRIKKIFFNDLFQTASQYETRSNITAVEWDLRKSESLVMLGPVLERLQNELLAPAIERTFAIMARAGLIPDAPGEFAGQQIDIEYVSMLATSQNAAQAAGIERLFAMAGNVVGVTGPEAMDNIDVDYALEKYSSMLNNDPRLTRSPAQLTAIRQARQQQQQQQQQVELAEKLAAGAKTLSETQVGGGQNALQQMTGRGIP